MLPETLVIGNTTIKLDAITSTNDYMHGLLTKGEKLTEGTVVIAENQQSGKGQRGNIWISEPGMNLTFSTVLYPKFLRPSDQFDLSKAISLGIVSYLREMLPVNLSEIKIKWPNDIYVGNEKICGILLENQVSGTWITHSIVGIGLNVNQEAFEEELGNPTSMRLQSDSSYDLNEALMELSRFIDRRYMELKGGNHRNMEMEYEDSLYKFEEKNEFIVRGKRITARIVGVARTGQLILEDEDGKNLTCDFKDTFLVDDDKS